VPGTCRRQVSGTVLGKITRTGKKGVIFRGSCYLSSRKNSGRYL
jgi:hypothetical protein